MGLLIALFAILLPLPAQTLPQYRKLWDDPEVVQRINAGIEAGRKGWATLRFLDAQGKPVTGVHAVIEQTSHKFLFGANLFMLSGFDTETENRRWEERFLGLFNYGTAPFYWAGLEPTRGDVRFAAGSPPIYRRPPPDLLVEFARKHAITLKGHPLVWDTLNLGFPDWAPLDPDEIERAFRIRLEQIAARYRDSIKVWDVFNEVFWRPRRLQVPMPFDVVVRSHRIAAQLFPLDAKLSVNEGTLDALGSPQVETSQYYLLIQNLRLRGARVDAIGMQCHVRQNLIGPTLQGQMFRPLEMLRTLDRYADFHLPIHVTEITIPTIPKTETGEAIQAEVARNFYRLWFSHPAVEAITWWNLADDTAHGDENKLRGGLVRRDLTPKPAYEALRKLIRDEWHTRVERDAAASSEIRFQGFYGNYTAVARHNGKSVKVEFPLAKGALNTVEVRF